MAGTIEREVSGGNIGRGKDQGRAGEDQRGREVTGEIRGSRGNNKQ